VPVFSGQKVQRNEPLYWHFNLAGGEFQLALRLGDWKILARLDKPFINRGNNVTDEDERAFKMAEPVSYALYNLRNDIGETRDRSADEPAKLEELKELLLKKYHHVRAESPNWPAWQFDNREGKRIAAPDYAKDRAKGKQAKK
jgi:arylsulfatase A